MDLTPSEGLRCDRQAVGYAVLLMNGSLYSQSGAAGHSQHDAVLQALDVRIYYTDTHGVAGLAATGEVLSIYLICFVLGRRIWVCDA